MHWLSRLIYRWRPLGRLDADLAEELADHLARKREALERSGMAAGEAERLSRRAMGNATLAREEARDQWGWAAPERAWKDARYAARMLWKQRTFAATALLTLGLGIGATTTVFSIVEMAIWRPLPFPEADRLVAVFAALPSPGRSYERATVPEYVEWRARSQAFEELAAFDSSSRQVLSGRASVEQLTVLPISTNFFDTLRRPPAQGRSFTADDGRVRDVAILSDACWRRHFSADPRAIGGVVTIDDRDYAIVGVAEAKPLEFMPTPDVFVPMKLEAATPLERTRRHVRTIGRLRAGVGIDAARADLETAARGLAAAAMAGETPAGVHLEGLREAYTGFNWRPLYFFLGAAMFVLLLTCANVASLLLARALGRQREFAIRRALGGGTSALIRQLVIEGALVALPGAALGLLLASWAADLVLPWLPPDYLGREVVSIDLGPRVFLFAACVSGLTAIAFGLAPALLAARSDQHALLAQGTRGATGSRAQQRARHALVVVEITMALVLLVGAGLFLGSLWRLTQVPLGFEPRDRFTMRVSLTGARYSDPARIVAFVDQLTAQARALPGIRAAAAGSSVPLASGPPARIVPGEGVVSDSAAEQRTIVHTSTPGYFDVLGIGFRSGRDFTAHDGAGAPRVAIVNETAARRLFPGQDAVGRRISILPGAGAPWLGSGTLEIVGVFSNVKEVEPDEIDFCSLYVPLAQSPMSPILLVASASVPPATLVHALRQRVASLDPSLPVSGVVTMAQRLDDALRVDRFHLLLIGAFAAMAAAIAAIGIYGAMSYSVEQRIRELGVRLALGADRRRLLALTLGRSLQLGLTGTVLGAVCAVALARVLGSALYMVPGEHAGLLYGVSSTDPATMAAACAAIAVLSLVAGLVPAHRASRVDPAVALRHE